MAATIRFDQVGLPGGLDNRSRSDIVAGVTVTISNIAPGTVNTLELLWKPPEDDTAAIAGASPAWTIVPKAGVSGKYRFKLTVDGQVIRKTITVRTPVLGLPIPAANELANPLASLIQNTLAEIEAAETNEAFSPFTSGSAFGWWKDLEELFRKLEQLFHPSTGHTHNGTGENGPPVSFTDLANIPANFSRGEFFTYTDTANKVAGPLATPPVVNELLLWILGGIAQEYGVDYTVRQVTGGSAPGYYICLATGSTAPGGGTFLSGANPSAGIDGQLISGDKLVTSYPTYPAP